MKVICVDLDKTLAFHEPGMKSNGKIGDPLEGAVEFTRQLSEIAPVVIHTSRLAGLDREDYLLAHALVNGWLQRHGFKYLAVMPKPDAIAYIDDRGVACRPQEFGPGTYEAAVVRVRQLNGG